MNSLNILSARVSPPPTPGPTRSGSLAALALPAKNSTDDQSTAEKLEEEEGPPPDLPLVWSADEQLDEQTSLLGKGHSTDTGSSDWLILPSQIASAVISSIRWVFSTLAAPGMYLIAFLYDDAGRFAPLRKLYGIDGSADDARTVLTKNKRTEEMSTRRPSVKSARTPAKNSSYSGISSESESEKERSMSEGEIQNSASTARHTRSKSLQSSDEIAPARRSIRIKLNNDDSLRQRKHRKTQSTNIPERSTGTMTASEVSLAALRSPISPASSSLTKYPRAPAPPRPLIPARTPSYQAESPNGSREKKVLVLDLDETLIHSMAKGGRMSTGHMVEVKLNTYIGVSGQASAGPQHPILYYVHKRPHCDDFLRRVCKWYDLVIFTASVQEYADPVIDWLELDRKFFSRRYYRQHCTYRHGAFIKDLSTVEADLSKVLILDNSPLSYMFHQDNAIPIEGWISDPQDNDLLHLVPLLEGLQYVTDVRALLALRGGEDGKHMSA